MYHMLQVLEEFGVKYILNVTTKCPNYFEEDGGFVYKRIAATDTGTQKLLQHFSEAFEFIGTDCTTLLPSSAIRHSYSSAGISLFDLYMYSVLQRS